MSQRLVTVLGEQFLLSCYQGSPYPRRNWAFKPTIERAVAESVIGSVKARQYKTFTEGQKHLAEKYAGFPFAEGKNNIKKI